MISDTFAAFNRGDLYPIELDRTVKQVDIMISVPGVKVKPTILENFTELKVERKKLKTCIECNEFFQDIRAIGWTREGTVCSGCYHEMFS